MARKIYGSVNGETKTIRRLYGKATGATGVTGTIDSGVGFAGNVTAFDGDTFWEAAREKIYLFKNNGGEYPSEVAIVCDSLGAGQYIYFVVLVSPFSGQYIEVFNTTDALALKNDYGITVTNSLVGYDYVSLSYTQGPTAIRIRKLYGSVNGQTKLIFQDIE